MTPVEFTAILVAVIAAIASIVTALISSHNGNKIDDLHILINDNLTRQIAASVAAATAAGVLQGIEQERTRNERLFK